jgi:AmmeMemoRadiSam system protein B
MAIVFAALVPHSPVLLPQIGKDHSSRLKETTNAFIKLSAALQSSQAETVLIISPHGNVRPGSFTMNLNPTFHADFSDFGDLATNRTWQGDIALAHRTRESLETTAPLLLTSEEKLDHGAAVPLSLLTEPSDSPKVLPLTYSGLPYEAHFTFGQILRRELQKNQTKIALVASGDLSHRLNHDAPAGYSPKGKKFDKKVIALLNEQKYPQLLDLDDELIIEAAECGLKSIIILAGILDSIKHQPQQLAYEAPFGVGYLTMNFRL